MFKIRFQTIIIFTFTAFGVLFFNNCHQKALLEDASPTPSTLTWMASLDEGLNTSKKLGKPILVYFFADWCGPCHLLENHTYSNSQVQKKLKSDFVIVKIDSSSPSENNMKWQKKYQVAGLPTIVFLDANGRTLPKGSFTGYVEADEFLKTLDEVQSQLNENGLNKN